MLEKVPAVLTLSSLPLMSPARTWYMAAGTGSPCNRKTLGQWWVDEFHCHPKAVWRMCSGYPWYPEGQKGRRAILQVFTGQVTPGAWTGSFIMFVELKAEYFLGGFGWHLKGNGDSHAADSPVPSLHFPSHHTSAVLNSACIPVGSMTSWHVHGQAGHGCFGQMGCWAFILTFLQR